MFSFFKCLLRPVSYETSRKLRFPTWLAFAEVFRLFALILLLPAVGCATREIPKADNVVPVVVVALPEMNPVREVRRYTGRLQAAERVEIRARVAGFLEEFLFQEGAEVARGTQLFSIDPRVWQAEVDQIQAEVTRLEKELDLAGQQAQRALKLKQSSAISAVELEQRLAAREIAIASLSQGRARLESARLKLSFTQVTAPIDGRVGRAMVTEGNLVGEAEPTLLTTLVKQDPLHLIFEIPESDLLQYAQVFSSSAYASEAPEVAVQFRLDDDAQVSRLARIDFRESEVDPNTGTIVVRAVVPNSDRRLIPGLFVRVALPVPRSELRPHIPEIAVSADQAGSYVLVVDEDRKVQRRNVILGPSADGVVAVESGLMPEDQVIVEGQIRVRPGDQVSIRSTPIASLAVKPMPEGEPR